MNPHLVVCYVCGREYGSRSIDIHVPKCLEKWKIENDRLPKSQRRPEPRAPQKIPDVALNGAGGQYNLQQFNQAAYEAAKDANLIECEVCGRRFLPASLAHHKKACRPGVETFIPKPPGYRKNRRVIIKKKNTMKPGTAGRRPSKTELAETNNVRKFILQQKKTNTFSASPSPASSPSTSRPGKPEIRPPLKARGTAGPSRKSVAETPAPSVTATANSLARLSIKGSTTGPQIVVCYICGREFTKASIGIHEPQCLGKWRTQNSQQPASLRRAEPQKPLVTTSGPPKTRDEINAQAYEVFKSNLAQCDRCGRRFQPDRLVVHQRSCKG